MSGAFDNSFDASFDTEDIAQADIVQVRDLVSLWYGVGEGHLVTGRPSASLALDLAIGPGGNSPVVKLTSTVGQGDETPT